MSTQGARPQQSPEADAAAAASATGRPPTRGPIRLGYQRPEPFRWNPEIPPAAAVALVVAELLVGIALLNPHAAAWLLVLIVAEYLAFRLIRPFRGLLRFQWFAAFSVVMGGIYLFGSRLLEVNEGPRPHTIEYWLTENQTYRHNAASAVRILWVCCPGVAWLAVLAAYSAGRRLVADGPGRNNLPSPNRSETPDG